MKQAEVEKRLKEEYPGAEFRVTIREFHEKEIVSIETDLIEEFTDRELVKLEEFREKRVKTTRTLTSAMEKARTRDIVRERITKILEPMVDKETTVFIETIKGSR